MASLLGVPGSYRAERESGKRCPELRFSGPAGGGNGHDQPATDTPLSPCKKVAQARHRIRQRIHGKTAQNSLKCVQVSATVAFTKSPFEFCPKRGRASSERS